MLSSSLSSAFAPSWKRFLPTLPGSSEENQGRWIRSVIHLHSVASHDACDNKPRKDGVPNEKCLQQLRKALCDLHYDAAFLTEHKDHMSEMSLLDTLNIRTGDALIQSELGVIGSIQSCPDGHKVHVFPGSENDLMLLGQLRHPAEVEGSVYKGYGGHGPEDVTRFRATDAVVAIAHPENKTLEEIRLIQPELIELYNTHGNLMGLKDGKKWPEVAKNAWNILRHIFNPIVQGDLFFLSFYREDVDALSKWADLLSSSRVSAIYGADSHRNIFDSPVYDGERIDSYRRTLRWFSNYIWVEGPITREVLMDSLRSGKVLPVNEVFGVPEGFSFQGSVAKSSDQHKISMSETAQFVPGATRLHVGLPAIAGGTRKLHTPRIFTVLYRANGAQWDMVARAEGASIDVEITEPGIYRAEARIIPLHLISYMRTNTKRVKKEYPWVVSNPIYLE